MADKDQNEQLIEEVKSISRGMGVNFANYVRIHDAVDVQRHHAGPE